MCIAYTQPNDDDPQPPGLYGSSSSQACVQGTNCSTYTVPVINALGLILVSLPGECGLPTTRVVLMCFDVMSSLRMRIQAIELCIRASHMMVDFLLHPLPGLQLALSGDYARSWLLASGWHVLATVVVLIDVISAPVLLSAPSLQLSPGFSMYLNCHERYGFCASWELVVRALWGNEYGLRCRRSTFMRALFLPHFVHQPL